MKIAIIPARGGSKRITLKNIKNFCGKPLISYSIEAAKRSELFDDIIVSTDSKKIASVSRKYGANIHSYRPKNLSDDYVTTGAVMAYEVNLLKNIIDNISVVCCIYATAPFIQKNDLIESSKFFDDNNWDYVFTAAEFNYPIQRGFKKSKTGGVKMVDPKHYNTRSQDLPAVYHDAGQFYWGTPEAWANTKKIFGPNSSIYELPVWRVQDIDTLQDWKRAELLFQAI